MIGAHYKPNSYGVHKILTSQRLSDVVEAAAEVIGDRAKSIAPVQTGAYRDSISVTPKMLRNRVAAHVGPHVDYAAAIEHGAHVMRRSLG